MKRKQQKMFVKNLTASIGIEIISKIESGRIPENWDGLELRQLIKDKAAVESYLDKEDKGYGKRSARYKFYANTVFVENL